MPNDDLRDAVHGLMGRAKDDLAELVALLRRAINRARSAERHMLPGPRFAPLVFGETFQRDGEHSLAALRA